MATKRRMKTADVERLANFVAWAVERAEEELDSGNAQGATRSFLSALARDGRKLVEVTP
jgi:hypothetical protein